MTFNVGIHVFQDVEVLDFAGPYEVFTTATRVAGKHQLTSDPPFNVFTVAKGHDLVAARAGLIVKPDFVLHSHPHIDVLVVPGGVVTELLDDADLIMWVRDVDSRSRLTTSICTGAFVLGKAGLLGGLSVTTHWEDIDDLRAMFPGLTVRTGQRWVDSGKIVTSAGISAGIDMSLHVVERLVDRQLAIATARQMDFDWTSGAA